MASKPVALLPPWPAFLPSMLCWSLYIEINPLLPSCSWLAFYKSNWKQTNAFKKKKKGTRLSRSSSNFYAVNQGCDWLIKSLGDRRGSPFNPSTTVMQPWPMGTTPALCERATWEEQVLPTLHRTKAIVSHQRPSTRRNPQLHIRHREQTGFRMHPPFLHIWVLSFHSKHLYYNLLY